MREMGWMSFRNGLLAMGVMGGHGKSENERGGQKSGSTGEENGKYG